VKIPGTGENQNDDFVIAVMNLPGSVIIFLCKPHVTLFLFIFKQIKTGINTRFN